ncbi:hypothetical protein [Clostridium magnum]|uniref:PIN domain-containing protein n=1 Tax=Clostridium magnum DSM 2767 TaxID=1121326 RepID=A0A168DV57_9CLOT|nr:hypothetical protein [Clostridium magnum]KZL91507.1 hypothetical protein CLMAG_32660 [Clostridium magnum DSM 2767]SHH45287.1 hypothetical protein SAMN02745944_00705 [Clostridium magnum DSM 2767]
MIKRTYLLDTNIVIKIWREYPTLLDDIEKSEEMDFKIHQDIAGELSRKEFKEIGGVPILSNRFIKLLNHIINNDNSKSTEINTYSDFIKHTSNSNMYLVNGNKISVNDFSLIRICKEHKDYILVTDDKKMINSAKHVLDSYRVLNFREFIEDLL